MSICIVLTIISDCKKDQHGCVSDSTNRFACFPDHYVCDNDKDCKDNSDEEGCADQAESGELYLIHV